MDETMSAVETTAQTVDNAAAAPEVVAPAAESAPKAEQQAAEGAGTAASEGGKKAPAQSRDANSYYKGLRQKAKEYDGVSNGIMNLARAKGLQPKNAGEAVQMLEADAAGKSYEEYIREQERANADFESRVKESDLYRDLEERAARNEADAELYRSGERMRKDLEAIRAVDPSVTSLEQLGDEFKELVRDMDGLSAYYVIKGREAVKKAAMPPATGAVGSKTDTDRDFTSEELDRLTSKDLDDPKVYARALRSMQNLK